MSDEKKIKEDSTTEIVKPITIKAISDLKRLDEKFKEDKKNKSNQKIKIEQATKIEPNQDEITQLIEMINEQYKLGRGKDLPQLTQISFRMAETAYQKKGTSSLGFLEDKPHYCLGLAALGIIIDIALDFQKSKKNKNKEVKNEPIVNNNHNSEDLVVSKSLKGDVPNIN